jgi:hypothetical protein
LDYLEPVYRDRHWTVFVVEASPGLVRASPSGDGDGR